MDTITVLAPAKLNLALDICGLLPNGYHDLDMIMQAVTLYERITLNKADEISLSLPGSALAPMPDNLAWKAAAAFFACTGLSAGVKITIRKSTPVQAGMAGGSADAAGVLYGLNELYADSLPQKLDCAALCALGKTLGADVPFCLTGGTCRVRGIGENIEPLPPLPRCGIVVVKPAYGVSTPAAFHAYDAAPAQTHPDVAGMAEAICHGDLAGVCARAANVLENACLAAPGGAALAPENAAIEAALCAAGALCALMTGSGSAVFGIFVSDAAAQKAAAALRANYPQVWVLGPALGGPKTV